MLNYAESTDCRRAIQLRYFDEMFSGPCDACDNCREPAEVTDCSTESRQFLSCIARLGQRGERFGAGYLIEILRGARTERILRRGHDTLSVYGIGKHLAVAEWRSLARTLLHQQLLAESQDGFSVLSLNESSWQVLRGERAVKAAKPPKKQRKIPSDLAAGSAGATDAVFERLRKLRKQLADAQGLPPYVIFHDATLREMAAARPRTLEQFATIRGVGAGKVARYGQQFVAALADGA